MTELVRETDSQVESGASASPKEGVWLKLALAVFSFLLGLVATYLNTTTLADKRQGIYSVTTEPLVTVADDIPATLKLGDIGKPRQVSKFSIAVRNTGDLKLTDAKVLVEFPSDATVLTSTHWTDPKRGINYTVESSSGQNVVGVSNVTLERGNAVIISAVIQSEKPVMPEVFLSGGGEKVAWLRATEGTLSSVSSNLEQVLKYLILSAVLPGLIAAIPNAIGMFIFGVFSEKQKQAQKYLMIPMSIAQILAALVKYFLLLRIIPPAYEVIRHFA